MAINERLIHTAAKAAGNKGQEGLILHLDAADVDSYDGDGSVWYDITDHEYIPTTDVSEHFNTVTFTSTGVDNASVEITAVGFQPDLVWIKGRNYAHYHRLTDSVRGVDKTLRSGRTDSEQSSDDFATLSFNADGFNYRDFQESDETLVAWCFKAGGKPTHTNIGGQTPTSGSKMVDGTAVTDNYPTADIYPTKQSVNTKLGFSITEYEGTLTSTQSDPGTSVPHGLGVPPELIIYKNKDTAAHWHVRVPFLGKNTVLKLNLTDDLNTLSSYPTGLPTANLVYTNYLTAENVDNYNYVMYAFASKRGVSKVGSYTGTGAAGNKVYTGFQPAWVMIKGTDQASDWIILDNKRDTSNPNSARLDANASSSEYTAENLMDFNGDGFTLVTTSASKNGSGKKFIYLAFAKNTKETELVPTAGNFTERTVTSGSVLEYDANDSTDYTDQAGSNNGTVTGATPHTDNTNSGDYWTFDGADLVNTGFKTGDLTNAGEISVEMWVRPDDVSSRSFFFGDHDGNGTDASGSFACEIDGSDNLNLNVSDGSGGVNQLRYAASNFSKYRDGSTWLHLVCCCNDDHLTIFIDGEVVAQKEAESMQSNTTYNIAIGAFSTATASIRYQGDMGLFRIYNKHLTLQEVKANYDATYGLYQYGDLKLHLDASSFPQKGESGYSNTPTAWEDLVTSNADSTITSCEFDSELGNSIVFNGTTSEIVLPSNLGIGTNGIATTEIWAKGSSLSSAVGTDILYQNAINGFFYVIFSTSTGLTARVANSSNSVQTDVVHAASNFNSYDWYHIAVTFSGASNPVKMYINGELVQQGNAQSTFRIVSTYNTIGAEQGSDVLTWNGEVGQVRTYANTLTQSQIRQNFNFTKNDYPNGYNGTLTNMSNSDWSSSGHFSFTADTDAVVTDLTPQMTAPFTMSVWVDQKTNSNTYNTIFGCTQIASPYSGASFFRVSNGDFIMAVNGGTDVTVGTPSAAGTFDHLVFVYYGGTSCRTFINGVGTDRTLNNAIAQPSSSTYVRVGDSGVSGWDASRMDVSDAKFFSKALTDDEVAAEYAKKQYAEG